MEDKDMMEASVASAFGDKAKDVEFTIVFVIAGTGTTRKCLGSLPEKYDLIKPSVTSTQTAFMILWFKRRCDL